MSRVAGIGGKLSMEVFRACPGALHILDTCLTLESPLYNYLFSLEALPLPSLIFLLRYFIM